MSRQRLLQRQLIAGVALLFLIYGPLSDPVQSEEKTPAIDVQRDSATNALGCRLPAAGSGSFVLRELCGDKATVLVFLSTECPISNGYIPTLNRLMADFADKGVKVIGVNSNEGCSLRELTAHRQEYDLKFPVLKDAGAVVADELNATNCPETVVIDDRGQIRYRGRIDDRYAKRGGAAGEVERFDLAVAIEEVLAGKPVSVDQTKVVGCKIARRSRPAVASAEVTFSEHVAPVLRDHCENCHRPGGIGPFALQTFEQAVLWADDIREFTSNRQMPPWLPADGAGDFHNRRAMSTDEIAVIEKWVKSGCAEGDKSRLPPPRQFSDDWAFGTPDMIVQPADSFEVPAEGKDVYRCFVLPTDFATDKFVEGIEVRPGNSRVVHHVIVFLDISNRSTQLDARDPKPGYSTSAGYPGFLPSGGLGGWAPGNLPRRLPTGVAKVLPAKAKLVIQVHYHPSGKVEQDQTQVGIYFSKQPVTRVVRVIPVMPFGGPLSGMYLPAGDNNAEVRCSLMLPNDVLALNVTPHMHLLGKDMDLTATLPDGTDLPLIRMQRWDFNWQESYQYRDPVSLPKGTRLSLVAHYDNSATNPSNPHRPPRNIRWGENTADEMCIAFLEVVPVEEARSPKDLKAPTPGELLREALLAKWKDETTRRSGR